MMKSNSKFNRVQSVINSLVSSQAPLGVVGLFALAVGRDASAMAGAEHSHTWVLSSHAALALENALIRAGQSPEQAASGVAAVLASGSAIEVKAALARLIALIEASHEATGDAGRLVQIMDGLAHQLLTQHLDLSDSADVRAALENTGMFDGAAVQALMESWTAKSESIGAVFDSVPLTQYDASLAQGEVLALLSQAAGAETVAGAAGAGAATGLTTAQIMVGLLGATVVLGASGGSSSNPTVTDTEAPSAPSVALTSDTGSSGSDKVTSNGALTVSGTEAGATVEYSTDGDTWTRSFTPVEGANTVYVRQINAAGKPSVASAALEFTLDTLAAAPTVVLTADTGSSGSDKVTSNGALTVSATESGATVEYSTDGDTWTRSFTPVEGANTVYVRQTDAAGNHSVASAALEFTLDTTAPQTGTIAMSVDRTAKTITLDLNEDLVGTDPQSSAFSVTTPIAGQAAANAVLSSTLVDGKLVLTLETAFNAGQVNVVYTKPATGAVLEDLAGNDVVSFFSGVVADGYIRGAQIWVDTDGDGQADVNSGVVTNAQGQFFLPMSVAISGALVMKGGVNIDTGLPNTVQLKAPVIEDFSKPVVINPLTTLVQTVLEQTPVAERTAESVSQAQAKVVTALGLTSDTNLLSYDPISEATSLQDAIDNAGGADTSALQTKLSTAVTAQKSAAQVVTAVAMVSGGDESASASMLATFATKIAAVTSGSNASFTETLDSALTEAASTNQTVAAKLAEAQTVLTSIANASTIDAVSQVQAVALDKVAPEAPIVTLAAVTKDTTPDVTVTLNTSNLDGSAVVVGDTVSLYVDGSVVQSFVLTSAMVQAGKAVVALDSALTDGNYAITAKLTDRAGNIGDLSNETVVTIDTTVVPPFVALANDSGVDADLRTNDGSLNVTGTETGALVEYRVEGGDWSASFNPVEGSNTVQVRQTDLAGNVSDASQALTFTLDTTATAPSVSLSNDTGTANGDLLTSDGAVSAAGTETGATVKFSVDGQTWTNSFTAVEGENTVYAQQTDVAGNVSPASEPLVFTLDTKAQAPTVGLATDSGSSGSDGVSHVGTLVVSATETGATVAFSVDGTNWTDSFAASEGDNTVKVRQTDAAGNVSEATTYSFTLDTQAPTAAAVIAKVFDNVPVDNTSDLASGDTTNDNTPTLKGTLTGTLATGEAIEVFDGEVSLGLVTDIQGSDWSFTPTSGLANGAHAFKTQVVDLAGNRSAFSAAFDLTVDATVPKALASITQLQDNLDGFGDALTAAQSVSAGGQTNDTTPVVTGTLSEALGEGEKVLVFDGATLLGVATVDGTTWSLQLTSAVASGSHSLTAAVENAGGNRSAPSSAFGFTVDTVAPSDPALSVSGEPLFDTARPVIEVTAEAGGSLVLAMDDGNGGVLVDPAKYTVEEVSAGHYTFTATQDLADGDYGLLARDAAGNLSAIPGGVQNPTNVFRVDATAPVSPEIQEARLTNDTTPEFTLKGYESGLTLVLGTKGLDGSLQAVPTNNYNVVDHLDGTYTLSVTTALNSGDYGVVAVDATDHQSPVPTSGSELNTFRIDAVAPTLASSKAVQYVDGFDGSLDVGDTVTLTFSEPVQLVQNLIDQGTVAAVNPTNGYSTTHVVTLGVALSSQTGQLNLNVGAVRDIAGNLTASPIAVDPFKDGSPNLDLALLYDQGLVLDVYQGREIDIPDLGTVVFLEAIDADDLTIGLSSMVLVSTVDGTQTLSRVDLPAGVFFVDTGDTGVLAVEKLALTDTTGTLTSASVIANVKQADTGSVSVYTFTVDSLGAALKAAVDGSATVLTLPSTPDVVYGKADLSKDSSTDFSDAIFVVDKWVDAAALGSTLAGNHAVLTQAFGANGVSSYFSLMDGSTALKVAHMPGQAWNVSVVGGEAFAHLKVGDAGSDYFVHLDIANEVVTPIDATSYDTIWNQDILPDNVGTADNDALVTSDSLGGYAFGFAGNDTLTGSTGDDVLAGGLGADRLIVSDGGVDVLSYGQIADSVANAADTVVGFGLDDLLDFHGMTGPAGAGYVSVVQAGASAPIAFGTGVDDWVFTSSTKTGTTLTVSLYANQDFFPTADGSGGGMLTVDVDTTLLPTGTTLSGSSNYFATVSGDTDFVAFLSDSGMMPITAGSWIGDLKFTLPSGTLEGNLQVGLTGVSWQGAGETLSQLNSLELTRDMDGAVSSGGGAVDDTLALAFAAIESIGDNQMVVEQNTEQGTLNVRYDTDPTAGVTVFSDVMHIEGITVALDPLHLVLL